MAGTTDEGSVFVSFPVWFLIHPKLLSKSFVKLTGPNAESGCPFFTDMALAKRFQSAHPELTSYVGANAHRDQMPALLDALEANGFTHVTLDHIRQGADFLSIDDVRAHLNRRGDGSH